MIAINHAKPSSSFIMRLCANYQLTFVILSVAKKLKAQLVILMKKSPTKRLKI